MFYNLYVQFWNKLKIVIYSEIFIFHNYSKKIQTFIVIVLQVKKKTKQIKKVITKQYCFKYACQMKNIFNL